MKLISFSFFKNRFISLSFLLKNMEMVNLNDLKLGKYGFLCPKCESVDTFKSLDADGNLWLYCNKCGYECIIK